MMLSNEKIYSGINNEGQVELPLYFPPPVYFTLDGAGAFSIFLSNKATHEWYYSTFIQLAYRKDSLDRPRMHPLTMYPMELMGIRYHPLSVFLKKVFISDSVMSFEPGNLIDNVISWINNKYYIVSRVDVSKFPGTRHFNKGTYIHGVYCFGYNKNKKLLKIIDYDSVGKLVILDITYENFIDAFFSEPTTSITLAQMKEDTKYELNLSHIKAEISDYINSVDSSKRYNLLFPVAHLKCSWGLDIYKDLVEFINYRHNNMGEIDYRPFHALYEHKTLMIGRLQYLEKLSLLNEAPLLISEYVKVFEKSNQVRMLVLKYNTSNNENLVKKIEDIMSELCDSEKRIMKTIYECLASE